MPSPTRLSLTSLLACALVACGGTGGEEPGSTAPARVPSARAGAPATGAWARSSRPANLDVRTQGQASPGAAPRFEWLARTAGAASGAALRAGPRDPVAAARAVLGLDAGAALRAGAAPGVEAVDEAVLAGVHDLGRGPVIVQFKRQVAGLEVYGERTAVLLTQALAPVARSGAVPAPTRAAPALPPFTLGGRAAIAAALGDLTGDVYAAGDLVPSASSTAADLRADLAPATAAARGAHLAHPARARPVLFPQGAALVPAYRVEVALRQADAPLLAYGYVVSAVDGAVLVRIDQVQFDAYAYRVWAAPADAAADPLLPYDGPVGLAATPLAAAAPDHFAPATVAQNSVSLQSYPFSRNDPWLPAGATVTTGNNVDAYADVSGQNGFDAQDFRAAVSAGALDYAYDFATAPGASANARAAIVQLFYDLNFFHDWYYDSGFDEAAGNGQQDNFGRGGQGGDPVHGEAQDSAGIDNADMTTQGDGTPSVMQMYLWTGNGPSNVQVTAPAAIVGTYQAPGAEFGPQSFDLSGTVVAAVPADGCTGTGTDASPPALTNAAAVTGKIALIDRGTCTFRYKTAAAQAAGAIGVIIRNTPTGNQTLTGMADDPAVTTAITIPAQHLGSADGQTFGAQLGAGVTARLYRPVTLQRDGSLDTLVVAHEWGHFISNRLIHDANGLTTNQAGGLGEGWADTHALLLAVREAAASVPTNATWNGTFGLSGWVAGGLDAFGNANDGYYFGIRRVPYSTDMTKDPLTFRHIADGQALVPAGSTIPVAFGADGSVNSEVHNTGEVWATMLWECYAAMLRDTQGASPRRTFDATRLQWKDYLVAAYKLTPRDPTLLEARDALLAAAYATDQRDYQLFWQAFAKRGAGVGASGPPSTSTDNNPVVESYDTNPLTVVSATFEAGAGSCTDGDGYLDAGESGTLHVALRNDGDVALAATTATASTTAAGLTIGAAPVTVPASDAGATVTVDVPAALAGTSTATGADVSLAFPDGATLKVSLLLDKDLVSGQVKPDAGKCATRSGGGGGCGSAPGTLDLTGLILLAAALALRLPRRRRAR